MINASAKGVVPPSLTMRLIVSGGSKEVLNTMQVLEHAVGDTLTKGQLASGLEFRLIEVATGSRSFEVLVVFRSTNASDQRPCPVVVRRLVLARQPCRCIEAEREVRITRDLVDRHGAAGSHGECLLRKEVAPRSEIDEHRLEGVDELVGRS